ncbi:sterol desaturase family protein [Paracoccus luteus]|uniref:sterol desaturase family protein n=1 Tax=Paracoccus luteus TaxID=2508543 RepID=UPI00106FCDE8|nr:sterol desaturase family protein [Paracoccus luteus]
MSRIRLMLSHPAIAIFVLAFAAGLAVTLTGPARLWALVPLGVLLQMVNEYLMHRFLFHLRPPRAQWAFDLLYRAHYGHHDFPSCASLFFVPGFVALPMLALHALAAAALGEWLFPGMGWRIAAAVTLTGGVGTFLVYEWFHMTAHLPVRRTAVERHVATLHNQHHFRDFSRWFHVSPGGEVIDRLLGTAISRDDLRAQSRAEFIRTLGLRPDDPRLLSARARIARAHGVAPADIARAAG